MQWTDGYDEEKVYEGKVLVKNFDEGYDCNIKCHDGDEATILCDRVFKTSIPAKVGDKCIYYDDDGAYAKIGLIESYDKIKDKFTVKSQNDVKSLVKADRIHKFVYEFPE